jgi:radical SAM protein with 4Fe4S-binding SPASM domain
VNDGNGFVFISHTGEVFPSGFLPVSAGNVRTESLLDLYRNSELFRNLRNYENLKGKCGLCEFKNICGGSRARAFAMTGDYMESDPFCVYVPKGAEAFADTIVV